jgi:hypothetical protein
MKSGALHMATPTPYMKAITLNTVIVSDGTAKVCRERRLKNHLHIF